MNTQDIFSSYSDELKNVEKELLEIFRSTALPITIIGKHIVSGGGKRIRPLFLLLSADLCGYKDAMRDHLAAIIESIHTASLLHDDVIDSADTRRGKPTANSIWGNQIVILVGDYLYSNALRLAVAQKNQKIMEALSEATTKMTEGEVLQLHRIADPSITMEDYYTIVSAKTGILMSASCRIGGILAGVDEDKEHALASFGLKTGIAFQLADDILDYTAESDDLGKKLGKDLGEGKITLPMICLLRAVSAEERAELEEIIKNHTKKGKQKNLKRILKLFAKYDVIEESMKIAQALIDEAKSKLLVFPDQQARQALFLMADYSMKRRN
ncbi:MAG: polyprenyl synthetase family protein [Dissulfurispiraceae bacterium]|jgi:octaprenyl-diphosphate synthase|nr:polyprenyl synthetase family protein [Dissulfurispiraceae bacterium]